MPQVTQNYRKPRAALEDIGADPGQVVNLTMFVEHDTAKLEILSRNVFGIFGEWEPAETLIPVPRLAVDGMLSEGRSRRPSRLIVACLKASAGELSGG